MPPPRVEVGRVRLHVAVGVSDAVSVEDELFGNGKERWIAMQNKLQIKPDNKEWD